MGSQIAAHFANAGVPSLLLDVTADAAAQGLKRARGLKPDPFFLPDGWTLVTHRLVRRRHAAAGRGRLDRRVRRRAARRQARAARASGQGAPRRAASSARTRRASRSACSPRGAATTSAATGWARTSSTRRATCGCSSSFRHPTPIRRCSPAWRLRRSAARQGRGDRQGLAELHRQPPRAVRRGARAGARGRGRLHDRRDRRHHRAADRPAEERHVPHARPGRRRHPGPRRPQPARAARRRDGARACSCCRRSSRRCSSAA